MLISACHRVDVGVLDDELVCTECDTICETQFSIIYAMEAVTNES